MHATFVLILQKQPAPRQLTDILMLLVLLRNAIQLAKLALKQHPALHATRVTEKVLTQELHLFVLRPVVQLVDIQTKTQAFA